MPADIAGQIEDIGFYELVGQITWRTLGHAQEMHALAHFRTEILPNLAGA